MSSPRRPTPPKAPSGAPRFPHVRVELRTGNPYLLVAAVRQELRSAGVEREAIGQFTSQALSGAADDLRQTCAEWVDTSRDTSEEGQLELE